VQEDVKNEFTLSVIVPCFKHDLYLKKTFESILNQSQKPNEVILVNDHSPDNTSKILNEINEKYGNKLNIKIIYNQINLGQAESINIACERAQTKYIMILNDDDYLYPDAVKIILNLIQKNPKLSLIGSTATCITSDEEIENIINNTKRQREMTYNITVHNPEDIREYRKFNDLNMTHSSSTFSKKTWKEVGGYYSDKSKRLVPFSDRDFQLRVGLLYPVGVLSDTPLAFWRSNSSVDAGLNS
jgi:glycosyltransferase involved in cell wall biosynthesis